MKDPKARMRMVWELAKAKMVCEGGDENEDGLDDQAVDADGNRKIAHGGCGHKQPTIRKEGLKLFAHHKASANDDSAAEGKTHLTASKVLQILKNISSQDIRDMGLSEEFARPEWMIITTLPVPPPQVRPSIQMDGTSRGEDDLTHKLSDVLKANANVRRCESEGAPVHVVQEFEQLLQVC